MSIHSLRPDHPVLGCAAVIGDALDQVARVDPGYMTSAQKADALRELTVAAERLAGLRLRVLAAADDVALDHGSRSASAWLAHETRSDIGPALRRVGWARPWTAAGPRSATGCPRAGSRRRRPA